MSDAEPKKEKIEMPDLSYVSTQRYMCTVLDEMRECCKMLNFALMPSLIEEAQILANRMEAALECQKDIKKLYEDVHKLKEVRRKLKKEVQDLIDKQ